MASSPNGRLVRTLYRALVRLGRRFDENPGSKALIYRHSLEHDANSYYDSILSSVLNNRNFYRPSSNTSVLKLVRSHFAEASIPNVDESDRIDVGLSFYKRLSSVWRNFMSNKSSTVCSGSLNSETEALEVELNESIEPGMILVAHPLLEGPLSRTVILLIQHDENGGSYGLVLNRPTEHTVNSAIKDLPPELVSKFGEQKVFYGGVVRRLQYLHSVPRCGGTEIGSASKPLFAGGSVTKVLSYLKRHPERVADFCFYVGCCTWDKDQLSRELAGGYWMPIKTHPDRLIELVRGPAEKTPEVLTGVNDLTAAAGAEIEREPREPVEDPNLDALRTSRRFRHGTLRQSVPAVDLWKVLLEKLGNEYRYFAALSPFFDTSNVESCDNP